ncbi:MAG: response regulator [Treponema sp.]|jgi:DNA-binding response OmpR family regulator|nr:response regulator [Treponema sp.]
MNTQNKILVVDDDPINRDFFQLMLSKLGFIVEEAGDGIDALGKLKKFHPDLILLDNIMPRMTGFELTKSLKEDPKYREIPIIMFSALDDVQDKLTSFELGVDDYITKPFNFSEVLARIKAALRNRELFAQIVVRESRLNLAEALNRDLKQNLSDFAHNIDDLDSAVALLSADGKTPDGESLQKMSGDIQEKTKKIRMHIAELDARIEKTILEWEALKKNEIGLSTLETQIRKFLHQES